MKSYLCMIVTICLATIYMPARASDRGGRPGHDPKGRPTERVHDPVAAKRQCAERLHKAVMAELQLDEQQKIAISKLFDEHMKRLNERTQKQTPKPADQEESRTRIRELERQAHAAREAGDHEQARKFYRQIRDLRQEMGGGKMADLNRMHREFIRQMTELLNENQVPQFRRIMKQIRMRNRRAQPLMEFMRAVRQAMPEVELEKGQRQAVGKIVREMMRKIDRPCDNPQIIEQIINDLRAKLSPELGEEKTEQFITALQEARKHIKAREPRHPPHGGPGSPPAQPEEKPAPEQPKPTEESE